MAKALQQKFGSTFKLKIEECASATNTPAEKTATQQEQALAAAKNHLMADPHVQNILENFGGSLDENSIKLVNS